ncbi:hypothetical protein LCGC14_0319690 [marine sediment metagenome]|uniref:Uncharacterized protein n=1 Tax=marine sediment metagenome TaxID=412755 RepID=A0A0F9W6S4_9ZZZZ
MWGDDGKYRGDLARERTAHQATKDQLTAMTHDREKLKLRVQALENEIERIEVDRATE